MKLLKISSISLLVMFSFVFSSPVLAEEPAFTTKAVVLATINIQDAKIISQEGNTLNISFNISNREGAQSGVKYGVKLLKIEGKKQITVDEYVYSEVLSVGENTTITKNITYSAPASLDGAYTVMLLAKNYSGLPLGNLRLGEVTLVSASETVEILPETCSLSLSSNKGTSLKLTEGAKATMTDDIFVTCTIKNNGKEEALSAPTFETFYRSIYGEEISQTGGDLSPVLLQPGESKALTLTLPKVTVPQAYVTKVFFKTGEVSSNYVLVNYTLSGLSATIQNFSLDKTSYKAKDTAKISFFWTSSVTKKDEMPAITMSANIVNQKQKACTAPVNQQLAGVGFVEIPVSITRDCENPQVAIVLTDANGNTLDQKALAFEAVKKSQNLFTGKSGIIMITVFAILVLAGLFVSFKNPKKKDGEGDISENKPDGHIDGSTLAILFFVFLFGLTLIPGGTAKADTVYLDSSGDCGSLASCSDYEYMILNFNTYQSTYTPGETITLYSSIEEKVPQYSNSGYFLWITFNGVRQKVVEGDQQIGYVTASSYSAQQTPGNYSIGYDGYVFGFSGIGEVYFSGGLPYTVVTPATVVVVARNESTGEESSDYITVNAGTPVRIKWTTQNASGKWFDCTFPGGTCGSSYGIVSEHWNNTLYYPQITTTYTVTER